MPDFDVNKILVVLVFLVVLIGIQIILKRSKFFRSNLGKSVYWPLKVTNTLALSKFASATVVECAELSFLVVAGRNGSPAIIELPSTSRSLISSETKVELEV
jgi:hypothetical protein